VGVAVAVAVGAVVVAGEAAEAAEVVVRKAARAFVSQMVSALTATVAEA
jgi:hypothetical protein